MNRWANPCDGSCRHGGQRPVIGAPKASEALPRPKPAAEDNPTDQPKR